VHIIADNDCCRLTARRDGELDSGSIDVAVANRGGIVVPARLDGNDAVIEQLA